MILQHGRKNKPSLRKCSTLANAETLEDIERVVLLTVPASPARRLNITKESVFSVCRCHFTVTGEKTAAEGGLNILSVNTKVLQQIQSSFIF